MSSVLPWNYNNGYDGHNYKTKRKIEEVVLVWEYIQKRWKHAKIII